MSIRPGGARHAPWRPIPEPAGCTNRAIRAPPGAGAPATGPCRVRSGNLQKPAEPGCLRGRTQDRSPEPRSWPATGPSAGRGPPTRTMPPSISARRRSGHAGVPSPSSPTGSAAPKAGASPPSLRCAPSSTAISACPTSWACGTPPRDASGPSTAGSTPRARPMPATAAWPARFPRWSCAAATLTSSMSATPASTGCATAALQRLTTDHNVGKPGLRAYPHPGGRSRGRGAGSTTRSRRPRPMTGSSSAPTASTVRWARRGSRPCSPSGRHPSRPRRDLVAAALAAPAHDNCTALVVDLLRLPAPSELDLEQDFRAADHRSALARARSSTASSSGRCWPTASTAASSRPATGLGERDVVIKFPKEATAGEAIFRQAFVREAWVASRVRSPWVGEVIEPRAGPAELPLHGGPVLSRRDPRATSRTAGRRSASPRGWRSRSSSPRPSTPCTGRVWSTATSSRTT